MTVPTPSEPDTFAPTAAFGATQRPQPTGVVRTEMIAGPDLSSRVAKSVVIGMKRQIIRQIAVIGGLGIVFAVLGAVFMVIDPDSTSSALLSVGLFITLMAVLIPFTTYRRVHAVWARCAPAGTPMSAEFSIDRITVVTGGVTTSIHASVITNVTHDGCILSVRTRQFAATTLAVVDDLVPPAVRADLLARFAA
ncbi:hypothetical protein [Gordonia aichiensis]